MVLPNCQFGQSLLSRFKPTQQEFAEAGALLENFNFASSPFSSARLSMVISVFSLDLLKQWTQSCRA